MVAVVAFSLCTDVVEVMVVRMVQFLNKRWPIVGGGTMGNFRESSYAYLLFKYCHMLTTITSNTSMHKEKATTATINAQKTLH